MLKAQCKSYQVNPLDELEDSPSEKLCQKIRGKKLEIQGLNALNMVP